LPPDRRDETLSPVDMLLAEVPVVRLDAAQSERIKHGQGVRFGAAPGARFRLYAPSGTFLGLGAQSADGWLNPHRLIATGGA
jgi:tRNA pseudouridine55 synthase